MNLDRYSPPAGLNNPLSLTTSLIRNVLAPQGFSVTDSANPSSDPESSRSAGVFPGNPESPWQPQESYLGIWISKQELASIPTSSPSWDHFKATADKDLGIPVLCDPDINGIPARRSGSASTLGSVAPPGGYHMGFPASREENARFHILDLLLHADPCYTRW